MSTFVVTGSRKFLRTGQTAGYRRIRHDVFHERRCHQFVPTRLSILPGEHCWNVSIRSTCLILTDFQGVWTWQCNEEGDCHDTQATQNAGMNHLKGSQGPGGVVNFPVN